MIFYQFNRYVTACYSLIGNKKEWFNEAGSVMVPVSKHDSL